MGLVRPGPALRRPGQPQARAQRWPARAPVACSVFGPRLTVPRPGVAEEALIHVLAPAEQHDLLMGRVVRHPHPLSPGWPGPRELPCPVRSIPGPGIGQGVVAGSAEHHHLVSTDVVRPSPSLHGPTACGRAVAGATPTRPSCTWSW